MIVKKRTIPIKILKNSALLRRMPINNPKIAQITSDLAKRMAGYKGEQALDFHLSKLSEKEYHIFHGLRHTNGKYFFQIDTLILTTRYALILEVKNFSGVLFFDPICNQLIQTNPAGDEKGYANPNEQANQQLQELKRWFEKRNIHLPIEFLVVISKPSTIIKTSPNYARILQRVKHIQYLNSEIEKISQSYKELIDTKEIKRISRQLIKEHQSETFDVLNFYKIPFAEVKTGVICPSCSSLSMKRLYATWYCKKCKTTSRDAHYQAVIDLFLLNSDKPVSNHEIRQFLELTSRTTSLKIMQSLSLPQTGTGKGRRYLPPPNYQDIADLDIQLY